MKLYKIIAEKNACYKANKNEIRKPRGIVVHSTGANNPYLSRYVQPIGYTGEMMKILGANKYKNDWCNNEKPENKEICCHAFIGKLTDGTVASCQILPWDIPDWNSGTGSLGEKVRAWKNGYIEFEICEDDLKNADYFNAVYKEAVELCAFLCREYGISPEKGILIDHSEGNKLGICSAHGDVAHWFPKFGKSMDTLRADVDKLLKTGDTTVTNDDFKDYTTSLEKGTVIFKDDLKTKAGTIEKTALYTIVGEKNGYGKLKSGAGWVDLRTADASPSATASFKVGDKCTVNQGAKTYWGQSLASFVYTTTYDVIEVNGDRVVFGIGKKVTAACNIKDLKRV